MCSEPDGHPPLERAAGASADGHEIVLITGEGDRFTAYQADAHAPTGAGIIVLPDYHGLTGFYRELALRFAETGVDAIAIDYYGRTAPPPPRDPSFEHERQARLHRTRQALRDHGSATYHRDEGAGDQSVSALWRIP